MALERLQNISKNNSYKDLTCPAPASTEGVTVIFHLSFPQKMEDFKRDRCVWFTWAVGPNPHISTICSVSNTSLALNDRRTVYIQLQLAHFSVLLCPTDSSVHIPGHLPHSQRSMTNQAPAQDPSLCFSAGKTSAGDHWGCLPTQKSRSVGPHHAGWHLPFQHVPVTVYSNTGPSIPRFPIIPKGENTGQDEVTQPGRLGFL